MRGIVGAGNASLFGLLICFVPLVFGAWFAMRPSERRFAFVSPLTLMGVFSAVCNFVLALANGARAVSTMNGLDLEAIRRVGAVLSEGLAPVVASFACVTVAWACVVIGVRRRS